MSSNEHSSPFASFSEISARFAGLKIDDNEDLFAYDGDKEELARTIGTWGFGANSYNQLGVDSADPCQPTLIETFLSIGPIVSISCGNSFTMMLTATGRLYGVGRNNYYQIGIENTASHKRPMLVEALKNIDIVQVATGHEHTIALASDGRVFGWGRNTQHQLGNTKNTSQQPHQIQALENVKVKKVACGSGYTMVIDCAYLVSSARIRASKTDSLSCSGDGNLWGFGQNNSFQIGYSGQLTPQSTPRLISAFQGVKVEAVACGSTHTLVVVSTSDGATQVWGMGSDNCGQLGLATGSNTNAPTPIQSLCSLPIAFAICGAYFSMVRTTDGQVYSFGQNSHGELGLGHTVYVVICF
jgi:alpha-tubulin suppressor-like RCC1 family protein